MTGLAILLSLSISALTVALVLLVAFADKRLRP